jgi:hypothetical protein
LYRQTVERHFQSGDGLAEFGMVSDLLLEFLQKLMSTGDVLCRLDWILLGLGFAWCGHGIGSPLHPNSIQARVERTLLSAAVDLALAVDVALARESKSKTKSGGQECPPYTLLASPWGWALRLFFKHRELDLLLHRIDAVHQHAHAVAQAIGLARALADDFARGFVVVIAVVG